MRKRGERYEVTVRLSVLEYNGWVRWMMGVCVVWERDCSANRYRAGLH